jgi:hypothetical protein
MPPRSVLLYCAITVLLNAVIALAWGLWREITFGQKQAEQIIELQRQLKDATEPARSPSP